MTPLPGLRTGVVLTPGSGDCEVAALGEVLRVGYAAPFAPLAERLLPGQLVALARLPEGRELVVWRWFDAVVLGAADGQIRLWEPAHGEVLAQPRDPAVRYLPGSRAYVSAGLPGADWWVAGPVVPAGEAAADLDDVRRFYADRELWACVG